MKPYLSYWIHGYNNIPDETIVNYHKLSAFLIQRTFGEVNFLTDKKSFDFFKDIKWSNVEYIFDDISSEYFVPWSISKLYAYKYLAQKSKPFIHLDYDVFLWRQLPDSLLTSDLFAQSPEKNMSDTYNIDKVFEYCQSLHIFDKIKPKDGINMGIFGGNDLDFIYKYASSAIEFVLDEKNKDFWNKNPEFVSPNDPACIAEQYYLKAYAQFYNRNIDYLFNNCWPTENQAVEMGYTHLMVGKNSERIKNQVRLMIKKLNLN